MSKLSRCDRDLLALYWREDNRGYLVRSAQKTNGKNIFLHRMIADRMGLDPRLEVDHINHDKQDNRRCNLRACTRAQNACNQPLSKNSTTGYKGVSAVGPGSFRARIQVNRKTILLGTFGTKIAAATAYARAAKKLHGEFAYFQVDPDGTLRGGA